MVNPRGSAKVRGAGHFDIDFTTMTLKRFWRDEDDQPKSEVLEMGHEGARDCFLQMYHDLTGDAGINYEEQLIHHAITLTPTKSYLSLATGAMS